jgi:hypothetical protein
VTFFFTLYRYVIANADAVTVAIAVIAVAATCNAAIVV